MEPITFVAPYYYNTVWYIFWLIVIWMNVIYYIGSGEQKILHANGSDPSQGVAILMTFIVIYYLGLRPLYRDFVDMMNYADIYRAFVPNYGYDPPSLSKEWLWHDIMVFFQHNGFTVHEFFLFIEFVYVMGMLLSVSILTRNNLWVAMMFMFLSFSFLGYGENGIRNGMASSIALVGLTFLAKYADFKNYINLIFGAGILILSYYTHRSMSLVFLSSLIALFVSKNVKANLLVWFICVALSAIYGDYMTRFISSLSGDERMIYYGNAVVDSSLFSRTGFRWDFILYSSLPIILAVWTAFFGKPTDNKYNFLINTYILSNAAWVLVNQIAYSNRFAYLSWFMMPLVLAYPLSNIQLVKHQSLLCGLFLFIQLAILYVFGF